MTQCLNFVVKVKYRFRSQGILYSAQIELNKVDEILDIQLQNI